MCLSTQSPSPPTVLSPTSTSGRVSSQAQELLSLFRALRTFPERMRGNTWNTVSSSVTLATLSLSLLRLPSMAWTSVVVLLGVQAEWRQVWQVEQQAQVQADLERQLKGPTLAHQAVVWRTRSSTTTVRWLLMATTQQEAIVASQSCHPQRHKSTLWRSAVKMRTVGKMVFTAALVFASDILMGMWVTSFLSWFDSFISQLVNRIFPFTLHLDHRNWSGTSTTHAPRVRSITGICLTTCTWILPANNLLVSVKIYIFQTILNFLHRNQANIWGWNCGMSRQYRVWKSEGEGKGRIEPLVGSLPGDQRKEPDQRNESERGRRRNLARDGWAGGAST